MDAISLLLLFFSLIIMIGAAVYAAIMKDLIFATIGTSLISLSLSVIFYLLHAPDVALTEAAIGVALSTIVFIIAIRNTKRYEDEK
ncbi:MAG: DUF4040 domain-containing protein [Bacteroidales bacterium]|nr:DUF4040 domain-containing protein [Bacteroidales bacterium]